MRTTVTLDKDLAAKVKDLAHRRKASFKATLNDLLRRGLLAQTSKIPEDRFVVRAHACGFRPGIDVGKLNQLVDQIEADDFAREAGSPR